MKFKDLINKAPPYDLEKLDEGQYKLIWVSGYWDAPISGLLEIEGQFFWFEMFQENEQWSQGEWFRRHAIIELTEEQLEKEFLVHEDFQKFVGTHMDINQIKPAPTFIPGQLNKFNELHSEYIKSQNFDENEVVGWIEK